jgi:hypothetical protein
MLEGFYVKENGFLILNVIILTFVSKFWVEVTKIKIRTLLMDFCWFFFALITVI